MKEFQYKAFLRDQVPPTNSTPGTLDDRDEQEAEAEAENGPYGANDPVNSPRHYVRGGIEVIEVLEKKMSPEAFKGFLMGNVLKYVLRHEYKNGTEDLKKARFYLERMIALDGSRSTTDTK